MKISKFEAVAMGISVIVMAGVLFLFQLDTGAGEGRREAALQQAAVFTATNTDKAEARYNALLEASEGDRVTRVIIDDIIYGEGSGVADGDTVSVHYIGRLQDGTEFANTYLSDEPFTFIIGETDVIPGWERALDGMQVGGRRIVVMPPEYAYGNEGKGAIPRNATLVFAIELLSVE